MNPRTLTPQEQAERVNLRTIYDAHEKWRAGRTSYKTEEEPANLRLTNEQRSRLEVLDFIADPPEKYFAYIKEDERDTIQGAARICAVATWVGDALSHPLTFWQGNAFKVWGTFGRPSERINFRFTGINGVPYSGTYYKSSGNYCRFRRMKGKK